ncbi:MAG: TonB-dependent receptor [Acidobacteria bacterium]|nr:TonB-dependent receptor [Acidobacteriota bacterium]
MNRILLLKRFAPLALCALAAPAVFAQVSTGSLGGLVLDSAGAVVPGAALVAKNEATGVEINTSSSEAGVYVFNSLPTGVYVITAEKTGFKKVSRSNVEIRIAQRLDLNVTLEVGQVQETVSVTAEAPLLETSSAERGQNISVKMMDNLPLFAGGIRNPRAFVNYMPGVTNNGEQSVSGSGGRAQEVLIDGASALNVESSAVFNFPSAEMFSEFKMLQSNYSAEYGRVGGGIEIYVAKSGTNWFHGAGFHNMRRDIWNANAWARNASTNPANSFRPKERFNETGGSVGGPVFIPKVYDGRNKTFFFTTLTRDLRPATLGFPLLTVPTAAMKGGNFSGAGVPVIFDPATTSGTTRQPFPGNMVPQARFSRIARNVVPLIPDPTRPSLAQNYDFVNESPFKRDIWSMKFDHAFTPGHRVSYFFSSEVQSQTDLSSFRGALGNGLENNQKPYNHRINHDFNLRPNLIMHTTYSFSITRQTWDNPYQKGAGSRLGFNGLTGDSDATPRIQFSGAAGLSPYGVQDGKVANGAQFNRQWWFSQGYSLVKGKHEYKFGYNWRRFSTRGEDLAGTNGRYVFNRAQTASPTALTSTGHEFASLLLGTVDVASNVVPPVLFDTTFYYDTAVYFQDNYRVNAKLTLNLGLRYEVPIGWHVPGGNGYSHVDINVANPGAGGRPGALVFSGTGPGRTGQKRFYPTDYSNIGPRIGFAYQLGPKTVIRGGWSIYYQGLSSGGCGCRAGFAGSNDLQSDGLNQVLNWDNGIPTQAGYRPPPIIDPSIVNFQSVQYQGPTAGQPGRIRNWSLNVQHEIKNFLIDLAYQGNRGSRLNSTMDLNALPTSLLSRGSLLQQRIDSPAAQAAGFRAPFATFPGNLSVAQSLRPFPQYLSVSSLFAGFGRSWYDALQLKVERRFGNYQMLTNYTWSKSLAYGHFRQVFGQGGLAAPQDFYNTAEAKSYMPFDIPHVLNILSTFDLPFGKGRKFLNSDNVALRTLASGWTIASAQVYRKGTLIQAATPGNPLGNGVLFAPQTKANRSGSPIRTGIDRTTLDPNNPATRFFTVGAYTAAPAFTLGTAAFFDSAFRQPAVFSENISIVKRTTLWQNDKNPVVLTYRTDAFNLFNRTNFGGVVGTIGNANFGRPTGPQNGARLITMGLRLEF